MTAAAWWAVGIAAFILVACFWADPVRRARHALGRRRQAELRAEALLLAGSHPPGATAG